MNRRAFTLLEMLLAVTLSAILMAAVLVVLGGVARDRRALRAISTPTHEPLIAQLRWDLANARTMSQAGDRQSLTLIGNGGLDRRMLAPTGRLVAVTYRCIANQLVREQEYLDDPARPQRWRETVAWNVRNVAVTWAGEDIAVVDAAIPVPPRVHVYLDIANEQLDRELWLK